MSADLLYSDTEEELRSSVRSLLERYADWSKVLVRTETDAPYDLDLWRRLSADIGAAGLPVPESSGGVGASWREVAVVCEELGRAVAPVPYLGSAVLATAALPDGDELLTALAAGEQIATLVVRVSTAPGAAFPDAVRADGDRLTGTVTHVLDALPAQQLVVPAEGADGPALYVVDASAATVTVRTSLDMTRPLADVALDGVEGRRVDTDAETALERALLIGVAMAAAEQLGLAERCLEVTVGHLKSRYQFGRKIGSFQALKHRMADVWMEVVQARAVARYAADCVSAGSDDAPIAAAVAAAHCSDVAVHAAEECVQLHGGLGFSWENSPHLYLKRAKTLQIAFGTPDRHRARLAHLADLPA